MGTDYDSFDAAADEAADAHARACREHGHCRVCGACPTAEAGLEAGLCQECFGISQEPTLADVAKVNAPRIIVRKDPP